MYVSTYFVEIQSIVLSNAMTSLFLCHCSQPFAALRPHPNLTDILPTQALFALSQASFLPRPL